MERKRTQKKTPCEKARTIRACQTKYQSTPSSNPIK